MTKPETTKVTVENLEAILDLYGANLSRLPDDIAEQVKQLTEVSVQANEVYLEAKNLDDLLDKNQTYVLPNISELETKIMLAVKNQQAHGDGNQTVVDMEVWKKSSRKGNQPGQINTNPSVAQRSWSEALRLPALVAASLLAGVLFGAYGGADAFFSDANTLTLASTTITDDFLYLGTDYSLDILTQINN